MGRCTCSAPPYCPDLVGLIDHPATFGHVWPVLGWNIHIYHCHLDVHPPIQVPMPFRFNWHQGGGRQNREIETTPRPRLSVKLAHWLSDVRQPGRGNLNSSPGSHLVNWISPVQQILGVLPDTGRDHVWGHDPGSHPAVQPAEGTRLLDPANPPLRPCDRPRLAIGPKIIQDQSPIHHRPKSPDACFRLREIRP